MNLRLVPWLGSVDRCITHPSLFLSEDFRSLLTLLPRVVIPPIESLSQPPTIAGQRTLIGAGAARTWPASKWLLTEKIATN